MNWNDLPSLAALRAFEALSRQKTLSGAARELNVTHAAISQHLRGLETYFGETLAQRDGQIMRLSKTGERLATALSEGFGTIHDAVAGIKAQTEARPVSITLTPTFAETWLMPRMGRFWSTYPDVQVSLTPSASLVDMRRDGFDMGIRFGRGDWPGVTAQPLVSSGYVVACAPNFTDKPNLAALGPLQDLPWFYSPGSTEHRVWGESLGVDFEGENVQPMPSHGLVLSAMRAGHGLGVVARMLIQNDIDAGLLKILFEGDAQGLGYHIIQKPGSILSPGASAFRKWLLREAQAQV